MLLILFVIGVIALFLLNHSRKHNYWKDRGVPTASGCHWLFGHYKDFFLAKKHIGLLFRDVYFEQSKAPYVGYFKFSTPGLMLRHPELIKAITTTNYSNFSENEMKVDKKNDFLMGNNAFVLHGEDWKTVRNHSTPLTTISRLKNYLPSIRSVGQALVTYVKDKGGELGVAELEVRKLVGMFTTDVIANAILGVENNTFINESSLFYKLTTQLFQSGMIDNLKIFIAFTFPSVGSYIGTRFSPKAFDNILLSLTRQRLNEPPVPGQQRHDILQVLKGFREKNKEVLTDKYIASHCFGFLLDGYETSSDNLCFILYLLAWHSDIQEKLRNEITNMIDETNDDYNVEHVEKLKYLHMVLSESLRHYPPLTVVTRICTADYHVPDTSLTITKGTPVTIPVYALHMDEQYFPDPEKFDPERFTDEAVAARDKFVYLPFGEGPRKCPGMRFAQLQVKLAVIHIILNFRLKPSSKSNYPLDIDPAVFVSRPLNGAWVQMETLRK